MFEFSQIQSYYNSQRIKDKLCLGFSKCLSFWKCRQEIIPFDNCELLFWEQIEYQSGSGAKPPENFATCRPPKNAFNFIQRFINQKRPRATSGPEHFRQFSSGPRKCWSAWTLYLYDFSASFTSQFICFFYLTLVSFLFSLEKLRLSIWLFKMMPFWWFNWTIIYWL